MIQWPAELPQDVLLDGHQPTYPKGGIRTDMDAGPAFQRRRYTAVPEPYRVAVMCDAAQQQRLREFYIHDTAYGTLEFEWQHPDTGQPATVRFVVGEEPQPQARSGDLWVVPLNIEVMP